MEIGEGSSSNGDPGEIARKIRAVVDGKKVSSKIYETQCCIFKVPKLVRKGMEEAYTPMVVSIGPYHRTDERLQSMEHFKLQYLWHFLGGESMPIPSLPKRVEGEFISDLSVELNQESHRLLVACVEKILEKEDEIRGSYADPISLSGDDFVQMVLLDSVFIIWCLDNLSMFSPSDDDIPSLQHRVVKSVFERVKLAEKEIVRDLLLLENQLPLFIIDEIYNIFYPATQGIGRRVGKFFGITLPPNWVSFADAALMRNRFTGSCQNEEPEETVDIMSSTASIPSSFNCVVSSGNLLALMRNSFAGSCQNEERKKTVDVMESTSASTRSSFICVVSSLMRNPFTGIMSSTASIPSSFNCVVSSLMRNRFTGSCQNEERKETDNIMSPTASELHAAGVKFQVADVKTTNLLKIEFDKHQGVLTIPRLFCDDTIQTIFRNVIALEHSMYKEPACITHYFHFLDCLINTKEDVQLLADNRIVENWMGSDVVYDMFNNISKNTWIVPDKYSYSRLSKELNDHCEKKWNKWMATLKNKYFAHPWAFISVIYAIVLLLLTIAQVILAILALPSLESYKINRTYLST